MNRLLSFLRLSTPVWLSIAALLATCVLLVSEPRTIQTLRNGVFDAYQRWQPREFQPTPVRMVNIDDESLARIGQWPWTRSRMAELIEKLAEAGASAIALDILYAEPDRSAPSEIFAPFFDRPGVRELAQSLPEPDEVFAEAIAAAPVVTSFALVSQDPGEPPTVKAPAIVAGDDPKPFLPTFSGSVNSLTPLQEAASGNGAMNVAVSTDGVVRKVQLLLSHDGTVYPSLTAEALRVALGGSNYMIKSSGASGEGRFGGKTGLVSVRIGDRVIYTDPNGGVLLHYTEPTDQRHIPAWQVLAGEVEPGALEGAIVFVGTTAAGLKDLRLDPLGNAVAGADIHAQAVEQILLDNYLTRPDWAKAVEVLLILILWALLVTAILRLGALWSALIGTIAVALAFLASWYAFTAHRLLLDPVVPAAGALAVFLVCSVSRHFETERKGKWVKDAFSSYISPNLVDYLIDNPDELDLVGVRRECSFVMTDLASFTSMVEKADPELIVSILNEYIEEMVKISLASGGTLDRIVGDAVAVMFSAPIRQEDHAERAVACALAMDEYSVAFRKRKAEEGLTVGKTRIGVHTGTVTIGNIGGETFFDYRALGDPVNTAARLETVNGQLGTRVCVSGFTVEQCSNFVGRSVGRLVLKGKSEGIPAFEPLPDEIASSQRVALYNAAFQLMKDESPEALAAFEALADTYPDDPLAKLHLERLQDGQVGDLLVFKKK